MIDIKLLEEIKADLIAHPETFNMCYWAGEAVCIVGKINKLRGGYNHDNVIVYGARMLNCPIPQARLLFHTVFWPKHLKEAYDKATDAKERAAIGCVAIDEWIKEHGK